MNNLSEVQSKSQSVLWHPCSQMKDYETFTPVNVVAAKGSVWTLANGQKIIDAVASWWCKNLGHGHPRLTRALITQAKQFEHVILANTTNELITELSTRLLTLNPHLGKVFYASEGSSAIEIALKMSVHARQIRGQPNKHKIMALTNGYHGETLFALAVSDLGQYCEPYRELAPKVAYIENIPYVASSYDPLWHNCSEENALIFTELERQHEQLNAIIVEPIVQAAGGMKIYSQDFLRRLGQWCQRHDVYLIVDEIMTGFCRTGKHFAYQHADIKPDFVCVGKGLTAGYLPMSAVLLTDHIYDIFYQDYRLGQSFLHSHTFSGNALAAAVALEHLAVIEEEDLLEQVARLENSLRVAMTTVKERTQKLKNLRYIGGIVAADIIVPDQSARAGYAVFQRAVELGAYLRPLGNTLYWVPPLNISRQHINKLRDITIKAIIETL